MATSVLVSGGFDPLHAGHVEYIQKAAQYGKVIVALNSDVWLLRKKGSVFMHWEERRAILMALKGVVAIYPVKDDDGTVCEAIESLHPDYFANGGDRTIGNTPEVDSCEKHGVGMLFGLGNKIRSSSELVARQWGSYKVLHEDEDCKIKLLTVLPGKATSLQTHENRNEHWVYPKTNRYVFHRKKDKHQLENYTKEPLKIIEIQTGTYFGEDDIVRY